MADQKEEVWMRGNIMNDIVITNNEYIAGKIRLKQKYKKALKEQGY